jgi:hypothetical protein
MPANQEQALNLGKDKFETLNLIDQFKVLKTVVESLKTGRAAGFDLELIDGKKKVGTIRVNSNISNFKYKEVYILDQSPAGLHVKKSINLMDLL